MSKLLSRQFLRALLVRMRINRAILAFFGALFCILVAGLYPQPIPLFFPYFDLALHFVAFFVLSGLALFVFPSDKILAGIVLLLLFGGFIELCQKFIFIERDFSWADLLANSFGIFMACILYSAFKFKRM